MRDAALPDADTPSSITKRFPAARDHSGRQIKRGKAGSDHASVVAKFGRKNVTRKAQISSADYSAQALPSTKSSSTYTVSGSQECECDFPSPNLVHLYHLFGIKSKRWRF
ncbi:hypothetical protein EPK99_01630 [Neorhizobium lilium]|uniref:Uncharacterized protein n=1 Tax=Neorhizobium lilium TaxID=2503024 RepID=A0A3S3RP46_9HYPH|nr:hypothetical protein [Neorhizobium lilium]RWX81058.1 hypothetical protein EPK99_01630 [Neorhizobium lilium]